MRKSGMISIIAASLLTATVVFTGCGGGGSSTTATATSSSSSSSEMAVKKVIVSDGYVLGATVKCKTGTNEPVAIATANSGEYEFSVAECPANLCAKDGYIDVNGNGVIDANEPKAPQMGAPGDYTNINPYTTFIANGMTPAELANALGMPADTNFDMPVPMGDAEFQKNAVLLSALLSYIQSQAAAQTRGILPDPNQTAAPASSSSVATSSSTSAAVLPGVGATTSSTPAAALPGVGATQNNPAAAVTPLSLETVIAELKTGKTITEVIPAPLQDLAVALDAAEPGKYDEVAAPVLATFNGAYAAETSSSSSSTALPGVGGGNVSSSQAASSSTPGILPNPGNATEVVEEPAVVLPGSQTTTSSSQVSSTSSEATQSTNSEATSSSTGDCLPGSDCATTNEESSTSESASTSEEASSSAGDCLPGSDCATSESTSSESSTSEASSSSAGDCLPGSEC